MTIITEDRPIEHISDDLFGRKPIVDLISNAIFSKTATAHGCYVIGIYGKWGEGKSSVFKLIKEQLLANKDDKIFISEFNPWLFKDQASLLMEFFNVLADERIDKKLAKQIKKYAPIIALGVQGLLSGAQFATGVPMPWIARLGKKISKVGKSMPDSTTTVSYRKKEISKTIKASGKHLVIFIDDIDRLDREETHAVFKLIKQNADFDNVIYLLAMDVEMVAKAIGGRFGAGGESDGYNFIDKIVQVPITLPQIQSSHLKLLFNKQLKEVISTLPTTHTSVVAHIATNTDKIVDVLAELFETKRDILRYINQIQFILPTLYEEVNVLDLCLLEAIKLFHPRGYKAIHRRRNVIFRQGDAEDSVLTYLQYKDKPDELKKIREAQREELIGDIMSSCPERQYLQIKWIIKEHILRPYFHDNISANDKQLCNINYFDKYFVGCTPDDKVSDFMLYELSEQINKIDCSYDELTGTINDILDKYGWEEVKRAVLFVIDLGKDSVEKNIATKNLSIAVSQISIAGKEAYFWIVEMFLCHIMNQMFLPVINPRENVKQDENIIFETSKIIIANATTEFLPNFAAILYDDVNITHEKKVDLVKKAISRIIETQGANELFRVGKYARVRLFTVWGKSARAELDAFVSQKISEPSFDVTKFLEEFVEDNNGIIDYTRLQDIFGKNQQLYDYILANVPKEQRETNKAIKSFLASFGALKVALPSDIADSE